MKNISLYIIAVVQILILCTCISVKKQPEVLPVIESSSLTQTIFALTLDQEIEENINLVYSPAFHAAWQSYAAQLSGGKIVLEEESEEADQLNNTQLIPDTRENDFFFGLAGLCEQGIREQIHNKLLDTNIPEESVKEITCEQGELVLFGYSEKKIGCKVPFEKNHVIEYGDGFTKVWGFGFGDLDLSFKYHKDLNDQLAIDYFKPDKNNIKIEYIVTVKTTSEEYDLILAKVIPKETLRETIQYVCEKRGKSDPVFLGARSIFLVPVFSLNLVHHFRLLEGKTIHHTGDGLAEIGQAIENIKFIFDEKGKKYAQLKFAFNVKNKYDLVFDTAFLLLLMRKGSTDPDLALWIANTELLKKIQNS